MRLKVLINDVLIKKKSVLKCLEMLVVKKHDAGAWVSQKNYYERFLVGWVPQKIMIMKDYWSGECCKK